MKHALLPLLLALLLAALPALAECPVQQAEPLTGMFVYPEGRTEADALYVYRYRYPQVTGSEEIALHINTTYAYMAEEKNIDSLNNKYEIQCLRKKGDGYQVMYVSTDRILIFDFDKNAVWIEKGRKESIRSLLNTVAQLDGIKEGDSVHVVQAVDHRSYIPFMARDEELPLESDHYTQDGYHVHIEYDAQHNVTSINKTAT